MRDFKNGLKKAGKIILFFTMLAVLLLGVSFGMLEVSGRKDILVKSRNKSIVGIQKEPENTIDVLVLGDSLSYTSISPMQLWKEQGITSYVCGQSGQTLWESYYMLKTALKTQKPKVVVMETNPLFRTHGEITDTQDILLEKGYYWFPVLRFHDIWKTLVEKWNYIGKRYKGFHLHKEIKPYKGREYMSRSTGKEEIPRAARYFMGKIRDACREAGAELLLVSTPSPRNYSKSTNRALSRYSGACGLKFLDLNFMWKELGIDWNRDTMDKGDHLNLSGAGKVTACLGGYLKKNYVLLDHRGEKAYQMWDKLWEEYDIYRKD